MVESIKQWLASRRKKKHYKKYERACRKYDKIHTKLKCQQVVVTQMALALSLKYEMSGGD